MEANNFRLEIKEKNARLLSPFAILLIPLHASKCFIYSFSLSKQDGGMGVNTLAPGAVFSYTTDG